MLAQAIRNVFKAAGQGPLSDFWYRPITPTSAAGIAVSEQTAMAIATWFACVRVLTDTVGALPLHVYKREGDDRKTRDTSHPWYGTLHDKPNAWQSPMTFKSMAIGHLLIRGNFYARVDPPNSWTPYPSLVPLNPDRMDPPVQQKDGSLVYRYKYKSGQAVDYDQTEVLHLKLLTVDGITGMSPLTYANETLGLAAAQTGYAASLFAGGGFIKYYLKTSKRLGAEGKKNFREGWRDLHGQAAKFEPPILEDDMDIKTLGMSNDDAQFLESRKFSAYEICQFLGVPPHLVFLLDRATFSNIEHQSIEFATMHLNPYLVRIEQELQPWLGDDHFAEFLRDALVRGDLASRYAAYNVGLQAGFLTRNEVRLRENLDPVDGGDELMEPLNMAPAGSQRGQQPTRQPDPDQEDEPQAATQTPDVRTFADTTEPEVQRPAVDLTPLIADAADRIVKAEVEKLSQRADKAAADPVKFFQYAQGWFDKSHRAYVSRVVGPILLADGRGFDADVFATEYIDAAVQEFASKEPSELIEDWKHNKAARVAAIMERKLCTTAS